MSMEKCKKEFVPRKIKRKQANSPWMTGTVAKAMKKRKKAWRRFLELPNDYCERKYKLLRNRLTLEITKAKRIFESKLTQNIKADPKSFYSYVKSKSRTIVKVGPLKDENKRIVTDSEEMRKVLNNYFTFVFTKEELASLSELSIDPNRIKLD